MPQRSTQTRKTENTTAVPYEGLGTRPVSAGSTYLSWLREVTGFHDVGG